VVVSGSRKRLKKEGRKMKRFARVVFVGSLFLLLSCAEILNPNRPPEKTPELLSQGKRLYENNCIQCHGPNGEGDGWKAAELKTKPRNFTLPFSQWTYSKGDPNKIFEVLTKGIPDTPMAMFHFSNEERWALVYRTMEFSRGVGQ
jgi:mono/diheme cytochrome c family protein